jgi:hypothetical protein
MICGSTRWQHGLDNAGVAQLVERNLAKVEVESSRLFSRSKRIKMGSCGFPFLSVQDVDSNKLSRQGAIANRLCNGLQIRLARFDSGSRLQPHAATLKPATKPCNQARQNRAFFSPALAL